MKPSDDREAAAVFDFIDEYLGDLESGRVRGLAEYLARHKGFEEAIAREYLALRGHDAAKERAEARDGARDDGERRIGPYRLLRELGRGGQGSVWLAEDVRIARKVALKVLASRFEGVSEDRRKRFRREAEAIAKLEHPGICPIYDADIECDTPWIAMRYVEGKTLAQLVGEAREALATGRAPEKHGDDSQASEVTTAWPPRTALDLTRTLLLFERCARALHAAHEAGVIHRDIKPGNLIVTLDGKPVVLDFGLARDESSDTGTITEEGEVFGTPAYMSPEQLASASSELDRRTDVYSLGVALYEALTLKRPFEADGKPGGRLALQALIADEPPPDPRAKNAALTLDVKVVLETALEKDRTRRYATALELAEDLRRIREYEPIKARPASVGLRFARWMRRHPALAAATIGAIGSLSVGLAASLYSLKQARDANEYALGKHLAQRAVALTREDPAAALVLGIQAVQKAPNDLTREALVQALEACRLGGMLYPRKGVLRDMQLSPDGSLVALACEEEGRVELFDARSYARASVLDRPGWKATAVAWTDDASALVVAYEERVDPKGVDAPAPRATIARWSIAAKRVASEAPLSIVADSLAIATDGTVLAVGRPASRASRSLDRSAQPPERALVLLDGASLVARAPLAAPIGDLDGACFAGGRASILCWSMRSSEAAAYDARDGTCVARYGGAPFDVIDVDEKAPSLRVALGDRDGRVVLLGDDLELEDAPPIELGAPLELVRVRGPILFAATARREGDASPSRTRSAHAWIVDRRSNETHELELRGSGTLVDARFSPDGARIACIGRSNALYVVDLATQRCDTILAGFMSPSQIAWGADGRMLFTRSIGPAAYAWFACGAPGAIAVAGREPATAAVLSPSGERAITRTAETSTAWHVAEERFERALVLDDVSRVHDAGMGAGYASLSSGAVPDAIEGLSRGQASCGFGAGERAWACAGRAGRWDELRVLTPPPRVEIAGGLGDPLGLFALAHSDDGRVHAALGVSGSVSVLGADEARPRPLDPDASASPAVAVALDATGRRLAVCRRDGSVDVFDQATRALSARLVDPRAKDVVAIAAFRPGSDELAVFGRDNRVRFWNVATGARVRSDALMFEPRSIAYSRDGRLLLVTGRTGGGAVRVFELEPFAPVKFDTFHSSELTAGELSADGRYVLTASRDGSVFVRESATGIVFARRTFEGREVVDAHFGGPSDDLRVIAVTDDGVVRVWPVDPLPTASKRYRRELDEAEIARERKHAGSLEYAPPEDD